MAHKDVQLVPDGGKVGPYESVYGDSLRNYNGELGRFRVFMSGAYNAYGLIGSECNGIVVLDNKEMRVLCDQIRRSDHSAYGQPPGVTLKEMHKAMLEWPDATFCDFINGHARARYKIEPAL
jgi:hypothetical protein